MQRCAHSLSTASALRTIFFPTSSQTCISTFLAPSYAADAPSNFSRSMSTATSVITAPSTSQRSYSSNSFAGQTQHYQARPGQQTQSPYAQQQQQQQHQQYQQQKSFSRVPSRGRRDDYIDQRSRSSYRFRQSSGPEADAAALRKFGVQRDRRPMNEEITEREVLLIGGLPGMKGQGRAGDGSGAGGNGNKIPHERHIKSRLLQNLDLTTHCLVQVGLDGETGTALCRVMERKEYFEYEQRRSKPSSGSGGTKTKQLELNWTIDTGDVRHRLKKALDLLDKGHKLEITFMNKKRQKPATPEQCNQLIETLTSAIKDAGHRIAKPMEGKIGASATFFFDPKQQQKPQTAPADEAEQPTA